MPGGPYKAHNFGHVNLNLAAQVLVSKGFYE